MPGARLRLNEREEIALGLAEGLSLRAIACEVGRPASTVSREVRRCGGSERYRATRAHELSTRRARRPKARKLVAGLRLRLEVEKGLLRLWSPEQIAKRIRLDFPRDKTMRVSHETIYQALFVQGRGGLRQELTKALRTGRARRYVKGPNPGRGKRGTLKDMVLISERPPEVQDRAVPGHWEGDLLIGRGQKSQVATLVERSTRFVMLVKLPERSAQTVRAALAKKILTLPQALRRTLTWDRGREMAQHRQFTVQTDVAVYFCDPHSPWQRGTNENTNGLLRQYMPKATDLSTLGDSDLNAIADSLNGRPRKTLDWMTPSEKFAELLQ
jgi:IS30 family transposase